MSYDANKTDELRLEFERYSSIGMTDSIHRDLFDQLRAADALIKELETAYGVRNDEVTGLLGMNKDLQAELAQLKQQAASQEPVAWRYRVKESFHTDWWNLIPVKYRWLNSIRYDVEPLYTAPPPAAPAAVPDDVAQVLAASLKEVMDAWPELSHGPTKLPPLKEQFAMFKRAHAALAMLAKTEGGK